jgi:hypothetical protein
MGVTRVGSDIHVNTSLAGEQQIAGTAYLAGGGVVVIWNDGPNPGDAQGKGVRGQMFSADGQPAGSEFVVNTTLQGDQSDAQVTALTGGRFVVVWKDASGQGGDAELTGVKLQVFGADGTKVDGEVLVNTAVAGNQAAPQVAALANGGFVVIWTDLSGGVGGAGGDSSSEAIKGQRFNSDGDPLGTEFRVNTTTPDGQFAPDVTALSGGGFAVSWSDASKTDGDSDWGVRAQVYNAAGQASGGELHVNTQKVGFQVEPEIYGLSNGALVVVWTDWDPAGDGSSYSIKAQVIGANGAKVGGEIAVNTATAGYQADPAAVALAGGGFAVAWSDNSLGVGGATGDSSNSAVKAQVFDNSGAKVGSEILVNTTVQGFQNKPSITATSDGGFAVGWSDSSQATMQMFAAAGTRIGGELRLSGSPGTQSDVGLLGLDDDQVFAVWRRYDEVGVTGYNIDAQVTMIAPVVTAVQVPGDGVHGTGDVLTFKVTFDEAITVSGGTPRLALDVGGVTRYATLTGGSGTTQLEFKYTVVAADNDADGIAISGLQANGATLTASGGDAAALTLNGVPSLDDVVVQGNAPPTLGGLTGTASFTEGADPVKVASSLTVTDPEGDELHSATVSITGGLKAAEDKLDLVTDDGMGDIEKNYDSTTGVLTLTSAGGVTEAQMQAALRAVTYSNSSQAPDTGIRTINVVVNDGQANSSPGTRVLTVTGVNDAPAGADKTITINEDAPRALTAADFGLTDTDGNTLASVKIVTSPLSGLQYNGAGIDSGSNISLADINAGKLIYTPPADASGTGLASFTFKVQDNGGTANGGVDLDPSANTITFDVTAVNDAPVIAHSGLVSAFAEGSAPVSVSPNATVSDVDSASLTSATVSITNNFQAGYDTLGFTNAAGMSEIAGDYNASTGVLTLSDTDGATPAEWQAALRAVTFSNSSDTLGSTTRQVSFTASDGTTTSAAAARGLSTAGQNDAPSGADKTVLMGEDTQYTVSASDLGFTDIDGNTLAAVKITTVPTAGVLYYDGNPVTAGEVTGLPS